MMENSTAHISTFGSQMFGIEYENRPAAYAVIKNDEGAFAVVGEGSGYFLPGGGSETVESPEETVNREVKEEIGRSIRIARKIGEAIQYFHAEGRFYQMNAVFFAAEFTDELFIEGECELLWLTPVELGQKLFHECHKWAITQI